MNKLTSLAALICATLALTACGGGGGGSTDTPATTPAATTETPMSTLVVPDTLNWDSGRQSPLAFRVLDDSTGAPIADANITLFSVTRVAPNSDVALAEPMPEAEIDSAVSDATGNASMTARIPAHLEEVMVVVAAGPAFVRQVVKPQVLSQTLELRLSR